MNPQFDTSIIESHKLKEHINELISVPKPVPHSDILKNLLDQVGPVDFRAEVYPEVKDLITRIQKDGVPAEEMSKLLTDYKVKQNHYLIISIEKILEIAHHNNWGLCKNTAFVYIFNGTFWETLDEEVLKGFLGQAAEKMGVPKFLARLYRFQEELFKQFLSTAYLPTPSAKKDSVIINLQNGTFELTPTGTRLRAFDQNDFLIYQLPFSYDQNASAPIFQKYLDRVLPDKNRQMILSEYMGYIFTRNGSIAKLEKVLVLYGLGANGKSVFHEIVNALIGPNNVSSFSIQSLTDQNGYYRAELSNKLLNYAPEINGNLQSSIFKQLASGEPVEARHPYQKPFTISQYAKMIFNANELPREVEHSHAFFRRFLIVPFDICIPDEEQDRQLHRKIIDAELSGVFNWVLDGLNRLLVNKNFTHSQAVKDAVTAYERESDSVRLFLDEFGYQKSTDHFEPLKPIYNDYRIFCAENGFKHCNMQTFKRRLRHMNIVLDKKNIGNVAYLIKDDRL